VTCTKEQLLRLSDWLNDNLQFDKGEDFNKLSDEKRLTEGQSLAINLQNATLKRKLEEVSQHLSAPQRGSDRPSEAQSPTTPGDDLCKTDKATVSRWLDLMAELIPQLPNGSTLQMQDNARRMKLMSKKLKKQLHKS
jgi:hypothetical protein